MCTFAAGFSDFADEGAKKGLAKLRQIYGKTAMRPLWHKPNDRYG
jgi:hypothetical protein